MRDLQASCVVILREENTAEWANKVLKRVDRCFSIKQESAVLEEMLSFLGMFFFLSQLLHLRGVFKLFWYLIIVLSLLPLLEL